MGLELFSPDEDRSAVVTGDPHAGGRRRARSSASPFATASAITVAGGHGDLKNRLFRIGHIGYYDVFDITTALAAVELALAEPGPTSSAAPPYARRSRRTPRPRRVRARTRESWSASRSPRPGSSSCAGTSTSTSTATRTSPT